MIAKSHVKSLLLGTKGLMARQVAYVHYRMTHNFEAEFDQCRRDFVISPSQYGMGSIDDLREEVLRNVRKHLITPDEYFLYDFCRLTEAERSAFVGDLERAFLCARLYNGNRAGMLFMDKYATYEKYSAYYGREVMRIADRGDFIDFRSFVDRHPLFIVKPNKASRGDGVRLVDLSSKTAKDARNEFDRIWQQGESVVEELIVQAPEMAQFHPESVNTVRYATFFDGDDVTILANFVKIGRGRSVVDNGGAGGFLAAIDLESGVVATPGRSEHGETFEVHPDTGVRIEGSIIPEWDSLKSLGDELARSTPEQRYVGWDFAFSDKGWVLVEGNSGGQFVGPQISQKKGMGNLIEKTFGRL